MMRIRYYHSLPSPDMWKGDGDHCPVVLAVSPSQPPGRWVVVKGKLQCQWLVASSFRILRSLFSNSTVKVASGILSLQPLPQFLSTQSPAISPFSLKIFSVFFVVVLFSAINPSFTQVLYFSSLGWHGSQARNEREKVSWWVVISHLFTNAFITWFIHTNIFQAFATCQVLWDWQIALTF